VGQDERSRSGTEDLAHEEVSTVVPPNRTVCETWPPKAPVVIPATPTFRKFERRQTQTISGVNQEVRSAPGFLPQTECQLIGRPVSSSNLRLQV
jgi:hypothetical protein